MAANATFALKAGVWFRRARLVMLSPDPRQSSPPSGRKSTYPAVQIPQASSVVWAHNSHIGDARYTDMGVVREELNIGQLCRQCFGPDAALISFATPPGTVAAATASA